MLRYLIVIWLDDLVKVLNKKIAHRIEVRVNYFGFEILYNDADIKKEGIPDLKQGMNTLCQNVYVYSVAKDGNPPWN